MSSESLNERQPLLLRDPPPCGGPTHVLSVKAVMAECAQLVPLAWPVSIGYLLQMSLNIAAIVALGQLGTNALASMALATLYANVTGFSIIVGMGAAIDTLCSQSFGEFLAGTAEKKELGRHLMRTMLVMTLTTIPIVILWTFTEDLLLLAGQDPVIAELSGKYTLLLIPALFPAVVSECVKRFLMAQGIMSAQMWVIGIVSPINCFLQYVFVFSEFRIDDSGSGAPFALALSHTLIALCLVLYTKFFEGGDAYAGCELDQILHPRKLWIVVQLAVSGVLMTCSEWWAWEIVALCTGLLGPAYLAAQTIVLTACSWAYTIPLGISIASTTRIGNALGAGCPEKAKTTAVVSLLCLGGIVSVANSSMLVLGRLFLARIFSNDEDVIALVNTILPIGAAFQIADVVGCLSGGILRGAGRPEIGAYLNLVGYYVVGIPLGVFCCFQLGLKMTGLWLGLTVALFVVSAIEIYMILRLDWDKESDNARSRSLNNLSIP
ncbi:hypothetical protein HDU83_008269 [Entophlyctis luteolus]|nr:hypothetical protein HDU82_000399 [Entophlyctis luteolus]KAJ3352218.1 hypothetical protein HDU83_008269 [Entophlyctis luteolus]KAJ3387496.1 hypothetical protein HDU84_000747 [Entophlyctis sp. JEL0112]